MDLDHVDYLPFQNFENFLNARYRNPKPSTNYVSFEENEMQPLSNSELARILDVSRNTIIRYKKHGIPFYKADFFACKMQSHPALIWADKYWIKQLQ